jgi:hypothetical protein
MNTELRSVDHRGCTVFNRWNARTVGSNLARGKDVQRVRVKTELYCEALFNDTAKNFKIR